MLHEPVAPCLVLQDGAFLEMIWLLRCENRRGQLTPPLAYFLEDASIYLVES
jgi:hypothetical protein